MRKLTDEFRFTDSCRVIHSFLLISKPLQLELLIFVVHSGAEISWRNHNDVLAGFVLCQRKELSEKLHYTYKTVKHSLSPFDSFLVLQRNQTFISAMRAREECEEDCTLAEKQTGSDRSLLSECGRSSGLRGRPEAGDKEQEVCFLSVLDTVERTRKILESVEIDLLCGESWRY